MGDAEIYLEAIRNVGPTQALSMTPEDGSTYLPNQRNEKGY